MWFQEGAISVQSLEGGLEEGVAQLTSSTPWVFQFASEAQERCLQLTGGWGLNGLVKSLQVSPRPLHYIYIV